MHVIQLCSNSIFHCENNLKTSGILYRTKVYTDIKKFTFMINEEK